MAAIAAAAIGAGASLFGSGVSAFGANRAAKAQKAEAERNREFQRAMYEHRYQWQMADMKKAGLNPILAYQQGPPGAPSGSPMVSAVNVGEPIARGVNQAVSTALQARRETALIENMRQDTAKKLEETYATATLGARNREQNKLIRKQQKLTDQQIRMLVRQYNILGADEASANAVEGVYRRNPWLRELETWRRGLFGGQPPVFTRRRR